MRYLKFAALFGLLLLVAGSAHAQVSVAVGIGPFYGSYGAAPVCNYGYYDYYPYYDSIVCSYGQTAVGPSAALTFEHATTDGTSCQRPRDRSTSRVGSLALSQRDKTVLRTTIYVHLLSASYRVGSLFR